MITVNNSLTLLEADNEFINLVNNRITVYGQIPYTVPEKLIIDIIKESARYFYRHYWRSTYKTFFHLPKSEVSAFLGISDANLTDYADYSVQLSSKIAIIKDIVEADVNTVQTAQELLGNIQMLQMTAPYGNTVAGINNSLYITEACCRMIEQQNYQSIFGTTVPFNFNPLTHQLYIHKTLSTNLLLQVECRIDIQFLYQDDLFIRHVIARVKQELKRLIAGHVIELPGGVQLQADEICNNIEDVDKVEEILKAGNGIGDIILTR